MKRITYVLLMCALTSCGGSTNVKSKKISKTDFGDKWPLTVDEGEVKCVDNLFIVFEADGKTYAVNGAAKDAMGQRRYIDIIEIWKRDPQYPDIGMDIGPVLDTGVELCK